MGYGYSSSVQSTPSAFGFVDHLHLLGDLSGVGRLGAVVGEVDLDPGPPAYLERLRNSASAEASVGIHVSQMCCVDAAVLGDDLAQLDKLVGVAPGVGVIRHSGGESDRALVHALPHYVARFVHRVAAQRDVPETDGFQTDGGVRDVVRGVDGYLAVVVRPEGRDAGHVEVFGRLAQDAGKVAAIYAVVVGGHRGVAEAVLAEYLGGDALAQSVGVLRVEQQHAVGVGVGVDEARRDCESGGVYDAARAGLREVSDLGDALSRRCRRLP